jgi:uncharacterized protein YggT (Ycf19 family)
MLDVFVVSVPDINPIQKLLKLLEQIHDAAIKHFQRHLQKLKRLDLSWCLFLLELELLFHLLLKVLQSAAKPVLLAL